MLKSRKLNSLGSSEVKVPELGFGGASLGNLFNEISDASAEKTIQMALNNSMTYIDTAPYYGFGLSEKRIGDVVRELDRDSFVLSTKVGRVLSRDDLSDTTQPRSGFISPMPYQATYDYSYDGIMRSYEDSLQRLGLEKIDILLVHDIGVMTHGDENDRYFRILFESGYKALDELKRDEMIGAIGLGVNEWEVCIEAMKNGQFDCFLLAGRYTLLEQEPLNNFLPYCKKHGASVIAGGVYNSGILATGSQGQDITHFNYEKAPKKIVERVRKIEQICHRFDVTLAAAALQFPLAHEVIASVVPGLGSETLVEKTIELFSEKIPIEFWDALKDVGLLLPNAPIPKVGK